MKIKNNLQLLLHNILIPNYWVFNFIISLVLLWLNPIVLLCWLIFFTVCLKYFKKLTRYSFNKIWLPIFILWYLILIVNLGKYSPLIIGPGYTEVLMGKALYDDIYFQRICFSTILTLHMVSCFLGFPVLIPIIFNFNKISTTGCAKEEDKESSNSKQSKSWFGGDKGTQNQKDAETCSKLADQMAPTQYRKPFYQHESMDSEDKKRETHNISIRVPGFGVQSICVTTDKKNSKKKEEK